MWQDLLAFLRERIEELDTLLKDGEYTDCLGLFIAKISNGRYGLIKEGNSYKLSIFY